MHVQLLLAERAVCHVQGDRANLAVDSINQMATVPKLEKLGAKIDPALKDWIDHVIVPGLVRQYLAREQQKTIGLKSMVVAHSPAHETSAEGSR
jgi:hypothetical protein